MFKSAINKKYPDLIFKVVFITTVPSNNIFKIFRQNDYVLAEDNIVQYNENQTISKNRYSNLIKYLSSNDIVGNFEALTEVGDEYVLSVTDDNCHVPPSKKDGNQYPFDESN
jgi:hypothetical protein